MNEGTCVVVVGIEKKEKKEPQIDLNFYSLLTFSLLLPKLQVMPLLHLIEVLYLFSLSSFPEKKFNGK